MQHKAATDGHTQRERNQRVMARHKTEGEVMWEKVRFTTAHARYTFGSAPKIITGEQRRFKLSAKMCVVMY